MSVPSGTATVSSATRSFRSPFTSILRGAMDRSAPERRTSPYTATSAPRARAASRGGLVVPDIGPGQPLETLAVDLNHCRHLEEPEGQRLGDALPDPLLLPPEVDRRVRQDNERSRLGRRPPHRAR